ncbi:MAG: DUF6282 family protein [Candidatus Pacebacteria bacterium]|nr:DUF6282 family protein [Candidatus Paceibacterota bacterium]
MDIKKILQQAIDLHVHIGPEIIPRKFNLPELLKQERGKIKGIAVKNHFFPTVAMEQKTKCMLFVIHSVVLNDYVGGLNPNVIRACAELSSRPIIVWFPTIHAQNILQNQKFEIPLEWIGKENIKKIKLQPTKNIQGINVLNEQNNISSQTVKVLKTIKKCGAILATGHLSWQESRKLVSMANKKFGIQKIIITHPIYQKIDMPIEIQKELVSTGALIEHCYSMYSIDKIPIAKIAAQIKDIGAKNCILSSDVGQVFSKSPSESLYDFVLLLKQEGISEQEIKIMLIDNPNKLIR